MICFVLCRALNGMQKKMGANGTPIAAVRSRSSSRTASPKWAIRAASYTGSPLASSKPLPGLCEPSLQALLCISCCEWPDVLVGNATQDGENGSGSSTQCITSRPE